MIGELARSALEVAGALVVVYGVWLVWPPAAYILGGSLVVLGANLWSIRPKESHDATADRGGPTDQD